MLRDQFSLTGPQGRIYLVSIAWPEAVAAPAQGWPAAMVMDTQQFERLLQSRPQWPAALIGVGYADEPAREADYPPCTQDGKTGGAADFLAFLVQQVLPHVQQRLPLNRCQLSLCGHSLAGLFVLYAAFHTRALFQHFLVSSPSVWWAEGAGVQACLNPKRDFSADQPRLFLSVGEYEQSLNPAEYALDVEERQRRAERRGARRMVDGAKELAQNLSVYPGLQVTFAILPGRHHGDAGTEAFGQTWARLLAL